jgi:hypothetical protein
VLHAFRQLLINRRDISKLIKGQCARPTFEAGAAHPIKDPENKKLIENFSVLTDRKH